MADDLFIENFALRLLEWWDIHGRKELPWQMDSDPYKIWLSEVMLQQTQVVKVIPYFQRFAKRFPSVEHLADAQQDEVLHLWSGLGYYARGRNLHAAAKKIAEDFDGVFPQDIESLMSLPGIGRSTAGAILAQSFELQVPILDGNVKRVLTRLAGIESWPGELQTEKKLWQLSESLLPEKRLRNYTQAIMDLGATLCVRSKPLCDSCPFKHECRARHLDKVANIPASKPKTKKPVREKVFLIIMSPQGKILLEKRPPTGIWGGLWSFPESDKDQLETMLQKLELEQVKQNWLEPGSHTFSHFRLDFYPLVIEAAQTFDSQVREQEGLIWYSTSGISEIGLAAPVSKILQQIGKN